MIDVPEPDQLELVHLQQLIRNTALVFTAHSKLYKFPCSLPPSINIMHALRRYNPNRFIAPNESYIQNWRQYYHVTISRRLQDGLRTEITSQCRSHRHTLGTRTHADGILGLVCYRVSIHLSNLYFPGRERNATCKRHLDCTGQLFIYFTTVSVRPRWGHTSSHSGRNGSIIRIKGLVSTWATSECAGGYQASVPGSRWYRWPRLRKDMVDSFIRLRIHVLESLGPADASHIRSTDQPTLEKMNLSGTGQLQSYFEAAMRKYEQGQAYSRSAIPRSRQESSLEMWKRNQLDRVNHDPIITTREIWNLKIQDGHKWQLQRLCLVVELALNGYECRRLNIWMNSLDEKKTRIKRKAGWAKSNQRLYKIKLQTKKNSFIWRPTYGASLKLTQSVNSINLQFLEATPE